MNSLVGYGVSSDSEDEDDSLTLESLKDNDAVEERKCRNFLLESESPSSESESAPENEDEEVMAPDQSSFEPLLTPSVHPHAHKLLPPPLGSSGTGGVLPASSVFANPFKEMADEKLNVLQKHVPLTLQARPTQIGGKRICLAYRKDGRCRFGSRCKFAHDSDLQGNQAVVSDNEPKENNPAETHSSDSLASCDVDKETDDNKASEQKRKKRAGINNSLIPPKRALKLYARLSQT